jgi:hypothetical protein
MIPKVENTLPVVHTLVRMDRQEALSQAVRLRGGAAPGLQALPPHQALQPALPARDPGLRQLIL